MNQRAERRVARWREQLYEFYAPLKAMRAEIEAKIAMRMKLQEKRFGPSIPRNRSWRLNRINGRNMKNCRTMTRTN